MDEKASLSKRGQQVANTVLRVDMKLYEAAQNDLYHATDNPGGALPLNMAENKLSWPFLKSKMEALTRQHPIPNWVSNYTSCLGSPDFRAALAHFISQFLCKCPIEAQTLGVAAGATAIVEISSWILGDSRDVAVFPAPCYPVYKQDIGNKSQMERYDLITHRELHEIYHEPALRICHLEQAKADIEKQGKRFRLLVITNPDNPTGGLYDHQIIEEIADWCVQHQIHLVVNEIYGLSIINTKHPIITEDYPQQRTFQSFAQLMSKRKSEYLHLWYALSKDLGASGFRVGVLHSHNAPFLQAFNNLSAPHLASNYTQWLFQLVLEDAEFMTNYIRKNQELLTNSYAVVVKYLKAMQVPYAPSRGSLFVWIDLSEFLSAPSAAAESQLWMELYEQTKILLTPSDGFGHAKKGQYRLVFPGISKANLEEAMKRLASFVTSKREKVQA
ncbi:MAG: aminotransferase class I/II-fold pyridoxal phosphate-dependent enzyme [Bacteroidota bacterium]